MPRKSMPGHHIIIRHHIVCFFHPFNKSFTNNIHPTLQTGANDVYVVETDEGKEILLPAIPSCILDVDVEAAKMIVRIPEGLL